MTKYLLLIPSEDGEPVKWLEDDEAKDIKQLMEDYSIREFIDWVDKDPMYFEEGQAMLIKAEVLKVRPKQVVESYEIEGVS